MMNFVKMTMEKENMGASSRHRARGLRLGPLVLACLAAASVAASAQTFEEFSGFSPVSINNNGTIVGGSEIRAADGTITTVNIRKAVSPATINSINNAGVSTGAWGDIDATNHAFIRAADGKITYFDDPDAGTNIQEGTVPESINAAGVIAGIYIRGVPHGFVRSADGKITNFDVSGAFLGTRPLSINTAGAVAGNYLDEADVSHGFVRSADGTITSFDAPGASTTGFFSGTFPLSINDQGVVVGYYLDASSGYHGFVRSANGLITTLDAPGAGTGKSPLTQFSLGTQARVINNKGVIAGYYLDAGEVYHGFMVSASGEITTFDAPGAFTTFGMGTLTTSINDNGVIIGQILYHIPGAFELTP